jgi:hypothetical protein
MLSNSVIAAGLASAYLTVLVLQLNPAYPLEPRALVPLGLTLAAAYGLNLTVAFYALIVLRQILAVEVLSPGWISVRLLSWLSTMAAAGGATLMWLNLLGFTPVLDVETAQRLATGAVIVSAAAALFLLIAIAHLGRRGGRGSAAFMSAVMLVSVVAPLAVRGPAQTAVVPALQAAQAPPPPSAGRVTLLMLDGASLDVISPAIAEGRLPNFGRIYDTGAVLHLATLRPTQAEPVWSTVATGKLPMASGVRSAASYRVIGSPSALTLLPDDVFAQALVRFGFLSLQPHVAADLAAKPIWTILGALDLSVGIIGWPLTSPAPPVQGFLVSDTFHRLDDELDFDRNGDIYPAPLAVAARAALPYAPDPDPVALVSILGRPPAGDYDMAADPAPVLADRVHLQLLGALPDVSTVRFLAVRFPGVDAVGHYFLRYAYPNAFGDVTDAERRVYGRVVDSYYGFLDAVAGKLIAAQGPDDLLLVVSGFGMEPLTPGKRLLERLVGNDRISGTHERAPDGFLLAYGTPVQPGRQVRGSVADITPTVLYFFGLPVGRDMDGFARTDLFQPAFTAVRPVAYIPTYGR